MMIKLIRKFDSSKILFEIFIIQGNIHSRDNLILCKFNYFEHCWCKLNSTEPIKCPYLLRHVISLSNSSHFCIYHTIRKTIECYNSSFIFPKINSVSNIYIYLTIFLFIIGLIGNGLSIIILLNKTLRRLSVYRNLIILCALNIFYLLAILIRHKNNYNQDIRDISPKLCRLHTFIVAFIGHLCSWQLVSTSIQRAHALFSLQLHFQTSWVCRNKSVLVFIYNENIVSSQFLFKVSSNRAGRGFLTSRSRLFLSVTYSIKSKFIIVYLKYLIITSCSRK